MRAQQAGLYPHDLGPFLVHRHGVEIVDLDVRRRANRVRHGPRILGELVCPQLAYVLDTLDPARPHVRREFLVSVHSEALFQRKLEPVAAGDTVTGPVMEILVCDHALDAEEVLVGGGIGACQHVLRVEDIQSLVFHRPHVEIVDRNDVVHLQITFPAILLLVPTHRLDQRAHRVITLVGVFRLDIDAQLHLTARCRGVVTLYITQVASHKSEQVARFGDGIVPLRVVPAVGQVAGSARVPVREQDRVTRLLGLDAHGETCHHVGPVGEPGDLAEALRLTLGAEHAPRAVEPLQRSVVLRLDYDLGLQHEGLGRVRHGQ